MQVFHMVPAHHSYRHSKRGIVLVATLVALMLIIGLVGMLQASALANTKTLKRLVQEENLRMEIDAVRTLSRPIVAEAMIQFDGPHRLSLQGEPYIVSFQEKNFKIKGTHESEKTVESLGSVDVQDSHLMLSLIQGCKQEESSLDPFRSNRCPVGAD